MTEINGLIPKRIKLIVNKGQDLQLYHPKKIIKNQPRKWRVLFLGVNEKMATAKVDSDTGNPEWLCEITVTAKNAQDPISLLVTDSKGRHIGQVLIPLNQIPPAPSDCGPGNRPPLIFSNIHKSELEPTKKNSYPKGYLYYWMWADDYWRVEDVVKMKTKKSLSRSMHDLSNSTLNLFRRKKSTTSYQESEVSSNNVQVRCSVDGNLRASPLKINNLKKKLKPGSDSSSSMTSQPMNRSDTMPSTPVYNGFYSKNPFDAMTTTDISIENNVKQEEPYNPGRSTNNQPNVTLNHQASIGSRESPTNKKKYGIFSKFKYKKSQSSADLTKTISDSEKRKMFPPLPQSVGKQEGQRLFEKKNDFSKSSSDISAWICGESQIPISNDQVPYRSSRRMIRPQSMLIRTTNDTYCPNPSPFNNYVDQNDHHNLPNGSSTLNRNPSPQATSDLQMKNRNREDMNKRELIDLVNLLETQLKTTSDRTKIVEKQLEKVATDKKEVQEELNTVKDELCRLKLRLLEAGDTKYLEKIEPRTRAEVLSDLSLWRANSKI